MKLDAEILKEKQRRQGGSRRFDAANCETAGSYRGRPRHHQLSQIPTESKVWATSTCEISVDTYKEEMKMDPRILASLNVGSLVARINQIG